MIHPGRFRPPATIMWMLVIAEPQMCGMEVMAILAPRCSGSAAIVSMVSEEASNKRSQISASFW